MPGIRILPEECAMRTYRTAQVAIETGIHPNTVRLYEELGLIPVAQRQTNGYRVFTNYHIEQIRLVRIALENEILQNGLRRQAVEIVKTSATRDLEEARRLADEYLQNIRRERHNALDAIVQVRAILADERPPVELSMKRKDAAEYLQITIDTLRNWELNGLLTVKRRQNGYRIYTEGDIRRLKIIRSLRCANFSLTAILRMLDALSRNDGVSLQTALDTPDRDADIVYVCDKLITALNEAEASAERMLRQIEILSEL